MDPALITGLFGLGSSLLSNKGAMNRQQYADRQNIKFWEMQNAYNTPAQQMARLKKAGLNPALIYGSGSTQTGMAGAVAPSKPAPYNIKNPVPLQAMLLEAQTKNLESITTKNNLEAKERELLMDQKFQSLRMKVINQQITNSNLDDKIKSSIKLVLSQAWQNAVATKEMVSQNALHDELRGMGVNPKASTEIANLLQSGSWLINGWINKVKQEALPKVESIFEDRKQGFKAALEALWKKRQNKPKG